MQIFAFFTKQFHSTVKGKDLILVLSLFVILLQYYKLWHKNLFHIRLKPLLFLISSQFWSQLMAILERPLAAKVKDLNFKWHHRKEGLLISEYSFSSLWHQCIHQVVSVLCNMDSVLQFPNNTVDVPPSLFLYRDQLWIQQTLNIYFKITPDSNLLLLLSLFYL